MSGGGSPGRLMGGPGGETGGGGSLSSFSPCSRSSVRGPCSAASTCRRRGKRGVKVNAVFMSSVCFINKKKWLESIACRLSGYLDTCSGKFVSSGEISFTPTRHTRGAEVVNSAQDYGLGSFFVFVFVFVRFTTRAFTADSDRGI